MLLTAAVVVGIIVIITVRAFIFATSFALIYFINFISLHIVLNRSPHGTNSAIKRILYTYILLYIYVGTCVVPTQRMC